MNNLIIVLCTLLYYSPIQIPESLSNNPINHIVSYESYSTISAASENESLDCKTNLYLFSNHQNKKIEVTYRLSSADKNETLTVTLLPLSAKQANGGEKQTITRPEKIGATCENAFEILGAFYVD